MIRPANLQILRFAIVGGTVAALYVLLYLAFLGLGLPQPLANAFAFILAVVVQYVGQSWWTFRQPLRAPDQMVRFGCTIGLGWLVSALITGLIGPGLGWADWLAAAVVTVVLPIQNYVIFRAWVFAGAGQQ